MLDLGAAARRAERAAVVRRMVEFMVAGDGWLCGGCNWGLLWCCYRLSRALLNNCWSSGPRPRSLIVSSSPKPELPKLGKRRGMSSPRRTTATCYVILTVATTIMSVVLVY